MRLSPLPNPTPPVRWRQLRYLRAGLAGDADAAVSPGCSDDQAGDASATPDPSVAAEAAANARSRSYRPTVNGQPLQLLRGDFHRHTELSFDGKGDGPLVDGYRYAIDAGQHGVGSAAAITTTAAAASTRGGSLRNSPTPTHCPRESCPCTITSAAWPIPKATATCCSPRAASAPCRIPPSQR